MLRQKIQSYITETHDHSHNQQPNNAVQMIELMCIVYFTSQSEATTLAAHQSLAKLKQLLKQCGEDKMLTPDINRDVFYLLELACLHRVFRKWKCDTRIHEFALAVKSTGLRACTAYSSADFTKLAEALNSKESLDLDLCLSLTQKAALAIPLTYDLAKTFLSTMGNTPRGGGP